MKEVGATKARTEKKSEKKKIQQTSPPTPHLLLTTLHSHSHPPGLLRHATGCEAERVDSEINGELLKEAMGLLFQRHPMLYARCFVDGLPRSADCGLLMPDHVTGCRFHGMKSKGKDAEPVTLQLVVRRPQSWP